MSKSRWMWISGFGMVALTSACAEGTTVEPTANVVPLGGPHEGVSGPSTASVADAV